MNSTKCAVCGFVSWATEETCKRCGAQFPAPDAGFLPEPSIEPAEIGSPAIDRKNERGRYGTRARILSGLVVVLALLVGFVAFRTSGRDQAQVMVLKDGTKKSSKMWFHSWFSSDPTVDEIFAQYLKVSGWKSNLSAVRNFVAKGRFQIKNEPGVTVVETRDASRLQVQVHWDSSNGQVEFEGEAPDKLVITQKYDEARVWQRGTNGAVGWWRKGWPDPASDVVDPHIRLTNTVYVGDCTKVQVTDLKGGADFINYFQLPNTYPQLFLIGKTMVGERVAYELINRSMNEAVEALYFDVETGMLLKFRSRRYEKPYLPVFDAYTLPYTDPLGAETYLEDYREINGVKLPFLIRQHTQYYWVNTTITDFRANTTIDPSVFEKPAP